MPSDFGENNGSFEITKAALKRYFHTKKKNMYCMYGMKKILLLIFFLHRHSPTLGKEKSIFM